ncbi:hypothetical protein STIAU_4488 [Stigmatella aurantiaca DW4/3-1]|nr:hypothetical protein STIAU_4488 [Stigmatella aurantiaca DW4/3-1]
MPDVVEGTRRRTYSRAAVWKALEEKRGRKSVAIGLYRTQWPALDMTLRLWLPPSPPRLYLWVAVQPLSFFSEAERSRKFVEMVRAWASRYAVTRATASSLAEDQLVEASHSGRAETTEMNEDGGIDEVSWLNVFGPKRVEKVGRVRMLSTPAHRLEELPNGAILLMTWPIAADFASDEARQAQAQVQAHLRPELDVSMLLRTLRERSATLAPVEPRFYPDVAPLLSRVVDRATISERQRKIAEFNAYRPPEPEEWRTVALPPDVEDEELVRKHYGHLAEGLVALVHTPLPSVFEATAESLTDIDSYFWTENFPETFARQNIEGHAVPAVGAYLGEVLVRRLGGQWIPRQKLEEAQVRVGHRVWLPFVRAHRYMRSRQALLDYSLTQFYREAERRRG